MSSKRSTGGGMAAPSPNASKRSLGSASARGKKAQTQAQAQPANAQTQPQEQQPEEQQEEQFYFEEVEVAADVDDDGMEYEAVPVPASPTDGEDDDEDAAGAAGEDADQQTAEEYEQLVKSLRNTVSLDAAASPSSTTTILPPIRGSTSARGGRKSSRDLSSPSAAAAANNAPSPSSSSSTVASHSTPADLWLLRKLRIWKLVKTAEMFEAEWSDLSEAGLTPTVEQVGLVPSSEIFQQWIKDQARMEEMEKELDKTGNIANQARVSWEKLRRERDFHRMHHSRVLQEKEVLLRDLKRLKKQNESFEPALQAMKAKYESAMKDKMLMRLERDRAKMKIEALEAQIKAWEAGNPAATGESKEESSASSSSHKEDGKGKKTRALGRTAHPKDNPWPSSLDISPTTAQLVQTELNSYEQFQLRKTFKGHTAAVTSLSLHPTKPLVVTGSDDASWKVWSVPRGELIMSGEGHKDWISGVAFHPFGGSLLSCSGDGTVKLWDLSRAHCSATFAEHSQAVWDVAWHGSGDWFVSASMDHTIKLWDGGSQRCRQTLRGHVDSVNSCCFAPNGTPFVLTASGDKTASLWDPRAGLCVQTFYGHSNALTHASFSPLSDAILTSDADGVAKVWDVRMVAEKVSFRSAGNQSINVAVFDPTGSRVALGSDDGTIKLFSTLDAKHLVDLDGHEDAVQSVLFDPQGQFIISASSDQTFRIWS